MKNELSRTMCFKIYELIKLSDGISRYRISKILGMTQSSVEGKLATMEKFGLLCYEDDRGILYPFLDRISA